MSIRVSLSDIADIKFCIVNSSKEAAADSKWIMAANLLCDNIILGKFEENKAKHDESLRVQKNDIIIKRISPSYINFIDDKLDNIYAYNNLIIVRPKAVDAKYLAYYFSRKIKDFSENISVGAVMPSIGRPELESFKIPILPVNEQKAIGELWYQGIEKKKMLLQLAKLENEKELYLLNKYVDKKMGGSKHDNI